MYIKSNNNSCFFIAIIVFFVFFAVLIKYWQLILIAFLVLYLYNKFTRPKDFIDVEETPKEFEAKKGVVYKVCSNCGAKADRNSQKCPECGQEF